MNYLNFTIIFFIFIIFKTFIENFLEKRNYHYIFQHRNEVPELFKGKISLEDHQKAADYALAKIKMGQFFHIIENLALLTFTIGGGLELLTRFSAISSLNNRAQGVFLLGLFSIVSFLISLPESIYTTFVIENKFGFNKMTPALFIADTLKGFLIGGLIGAPLFYGVLIIMDSVKIWWPFVFIFFVIIQLLLIYIYPIFIAPLFNQFTPLENETLKIQIHQLLQKCQFEANGLFVMDASKRSGHGNAYFTGLGKKKRIVFFDTLLTSLDTDEVEAVLAHELGHMKKNHVLKGMIKGFILTLIGLYTLWYLQNLPAFFLGHGIHTITNANILLLFSLVLPIYIFWLTPLSAHFSRKHEFEADQFACQHASGKKLISALIKMYNDNKSTLTPDPLYSRYYYSHPDAMTRINEIENNIK